MPQSRNVTVSLPLDLIQAMNVSAAVQGISLREFVERAALAALRARPEREQRLINEALGRNDG